MWKSAWPSRIAFLLCAAPLAALAWTWYFHGLGINRLEYVARYTGSWTLRFLLLTLAITPLRRLPGLAPIVRLRRMLGLFTFLYGTLHCLHYFALDAQWNREVITEDLTFRRFFIAGAVALVLMAPLAATSFNGAIRWMGGRRWQLLHRLVYPASVAALVHYLWQGKAIHLTPLYYAAVLAVLLAARVVLWISKRRHAAAR